MAGALLKNAMPAGTCDALPAERPVEKLGGMTPEQLEEIPGIGPEMVEQIQGAVVAYYGQYEAQEEAMANEGGEPAETAAAEAPAAEAMEPQSVTIDRQDAAADPPVPNPGHETGPTADKGEQV